MKKQLLIGAVAAALSVAATALPALADIAPATTNGTVVTDVLISDGGDGLGGGNDERLMTMTTTVGGFSYSTTVRYIDTNNSGVFESKGDLVQSAYTRL